MCGRYTLITPGNIPERFSTSNTLAELSGPPDYISKPNYNAAPSFNMPVVTRNSPNKIEIMKWGFIPHWAKDPKIGFKMINARDDSVNKKASFRTPFNKQRCLVPANGFYEWKKDGTNKKTWEEAIEHLDKQEENIKINVDLAIKIPYYFKLKDESLFAFAGMYDVWKDAEGREIRSYTIITTGPNEITKPVHNRMPVILKPQDEDVWLDTETEEKVLLELLHPYPKDEMTAAVVSPEVNSPRNNTPELIKPI